MSTANNAPRVKKGSKLKDGIVRWNPDEYLQLACAMLPVMAKGKTKGQALHLAQRLLPKGRQRHVEDLGHNVNSPLMKTALAQADAMGSDARKALLEEMQADLRKTLQAKLPKPKPEKPAPSYELKADARGRMRPMHLVRWTDRELALIARRVAYYQRDLQDKRVLSRLIKVAQDIELPPERRRSENGIDATMSRMQEQLLRGYTLSYSLLADVPFDAGLKAYPTPAVAFEFVDEQKPEPAREESPGVNIDGPRKPAEAAQAPEPVSAPTPPPQPRAPVTEPIRAFGEVFAQGMSDLIQNMTRQMMGELELRLSAMSERLMQNAIDTMARGVTTMVHSALERELGGPVDEGAAASFSLPEGAALPTQLKLDVIGVNGALASEIKKTLNGYGGAIRFIEQDKLDSWQPQHNRTVILNAKFISHAVERRCSNAGIKPIKVRGGSGAIVNAVRELYAQEGVTLPH